MNQPQNPTEGAPCDLTPAPEGSDGEAIKNPAAVLAKNTRLLAANAKLTARVSELENLLTDAHASRDKAAESSAASVEEWKQRWHAEAIEKPLVAQLQAAAVGPARYLRDTCVNMGLLRMVPGDDGLPRPHWVDQDGNPADLSRGLQAFLSQVYDALVKDGKAGDLGNCLAGTGASGGGATGNRASALGLPPSAQSPQPKPQTRALGLQ